jgi:hypothetical protein
MSFAEGGSKMWSSSWSHSHFAYPMIVISVVRFSGFVFAIEQTHSHLFPTLVF